MIFGLCLFLLMFLGGNSVFAGCETTISDGGKFLINNNVSFQLTIKNTGESNINWIKVPINFGNILTSVNMSVPGWSQEVSSDSVVFSNWYLPAGGSVSFDINGLTGGDLGSYSWIPQASETDESAAFSCSSVDLSIVSTLQSPAPVTISNVVVTVDSSSATMNWQTDVDSVGSVDYGLTAGYGSNKIESSSAKNHTITLTGLSANTLYHYRINSQNNNGTTSTGDYNLTTSSKGETQAPVVINTVTTTVITTTPTPVLTDVVSPVVKITTVFDKPFRAPPLIEGVASDGGAINSGVSKIEYSTDAGKNWMPVDFVEKLGSVRTTFSFTPLNLDDGNYFIKVRAYDSTGNVGFSKVLTLVIDRLPPQAGSGLFFVGPMVLRPDSSGQYYFVAGSKLRTIWSTVGGPINFEIKYGDTTKSLIKNQENGLWGGDMVLDSVGSFKLNTTLVDGANNKNDYNLGTVVALPRGKVKAENNIENAKVSVFTYEESEKKYVLWNGEPYDQINPQLTNAEGEYSLMLPEGRYYLEVESPNKQKIRTSIFEITSPTPIINNFIMKKGNWWTNWWPENLEIRTDEYIKPSELNLLWKNKSMPDFDFGKDNINLSRILGKNIVLSLVTSWMPNFSEQMSRLDEMQKSSSQTRIIAVFEQESKSKIENLKKIGNYNFELVADSDGIITESLGIHGIPTNVFLDRKGIINEVIVGLLN